MRPVSRVANKLQDQIAYPPRGMRADRAAAYLGMSRSQFLTLVDKGTMPRPIKIGAMAVWDRFALDRAFEELREAESENTIDALLRRDLG